MELWPWWLGALAFALLPLGYALAIRRPLGVAGHIQVVLDRSQLRAERDPALSQDDLEAALREATLAQFGAAALADAPSAEPAQAEQSARVPRLGYVRSAVFLGGVVLGGVVSAALAGSAPESIPTGTFAHFFGSGAGAFAALFGGGLLVGVGTTLAGGCTSGHGLVGCSRVQPGSLVATAIFFGCAIAVSFLLSALFGVAS